MRTTGQITCFAQRKEDNEERPITVIGELSYGTRVFLSRLFFVRPNERPT